MLGTLLKNERHQQNMSQYALAEGICSVSYLSKIESNLVTPSDEIMAFLFDCLGINLVHDTVVLERFDTLFHEFWNQHIDFVQLEPTDELRSLARECIYSRSTINAHLALYYTERDQSYIVNLASFIDIMTSDQLFTYVCAHSETLTDIQKIDFLNQYKRIDRYGMLHHQLGVAYFLHGSYYSAIDNLNSAYQMFSDAGNVNGMYQSSLMLGSAYANLTYTSPDQIKMMLHYYNRGLRLTRYIKDSIAPISINYNIGATYLLVGKYDAAQEHLERALHDSRNLDIHDEDLHTLILQKLSLLYIFQNNIAAASRLHEHMEPKGNRLTEAVYDLIAYMIEEPTYLHQPEYGTYLEACKVIAEQDAHHGYVLMYVKFLIQYYSANRIYKKALNLTEKYNIS